MGIVAWIAVGAIAGWLADTLVLGGSLGVLRNVVFGTVGTFVGAWLAGRFLGMPNTISEFGAVTVVVASLALAVASVVVNLKV